MGIDAATMVMDGSEVPKMNRLMFVAGIDDGCQQGGTSKPG
jgi:hypothetical protein